MGDVSIDAKSGRDTITPAESAAASMRPTEIELIAPILLTWLAIFVPTFALLNAFPRLDDLGSFAITHCAVGLVMTNVWISFYGKMTVMAFLAVLFTSTKIVSAFLAEVGDDFFEFVTAGIVIPAITAIVFLRCVASLRLRWMTILVPTLSVLAAAAITTIMFGKGQQRQFLHVAVWLSVGGYFLTAAVAFLKFRGIHLAFGRSQN